MMIFGLNGKTQITNLGEYTNYESYECWGRAMARPQRNEKIRNIRNSYIRSLFVIRAIKNLTVLSGQRDTRKKYSRS